MRLSSVDNASTGNHPAHVGGLTERSLEETYYAMSEYRPSSSQSRQCRSRRQRQAPPFHRYAATFESVGIKPTAEAFARRYRLMASGGLSPVWETESSQWLLGITCQNQRSLNIRSIMEEPIHGFRMSPNGFCLWCEHGYVASKVLFRTGDSIRSLSSFGYILGLRW